MTVRNRRWAQFASAPGWPIRRRRRAAGRGMDHPLARPALGTLAGAVAAGASLAADTVVPVSVLSPSRAAVLLAALIGAVVTLAGFTFWMRSLMVQLVSRHVSPRVLSVYLADRFQQRLLGFMAGAFAYTVIVFVALGSGPTPAVSLAGSVLATLGALGAMLMAVRTSVRGLQVGELVHRIAAEAIDRLPDAERDGSGRPPPPEPPPAAGGRIVRAPESGWVVAIDESAVLGALPDGATARLEVPTGTFVTRRSELLTVWADQPPDTRALREAVTLSASRGQAQDLQLSLQLLGDVGEQALMLGSNDSTAAYEVLSHLRWVLGEALLSRPPPRVLTAEDRRLIRPPAQAATSLIRESFGRIRLAGAEHPSVATAILQTLGRLAEELHTAGCHRFDDELHAEASRTITTCRRGDALDGDLTEVREAAAEWDLAEAQLGG